MKRIAARVLAVALALAPAAADSARTGNGAALRVCFLDLASLARLCADAPPEAGRTTAPRDG